MGAIIVVGAVLKALNRRLDKKIANARESLQARVVSGLFVTDYDKTRELSTERKIG